METEESKTDQEKIKAFLVMVKSDPGYSIKTIYGGEKIFILEKGKEIIWIIDVFKGKYSLDFITKEAAEAIIELMHEDEAPLAIIPDELWETERGKKVIAEADRIAKSIEDYQKGLKKPEGG